MAEVQIYGWAPGMNKVACDRLLKSTLSIGLLQAKGIVDSVLGGGTEVVTLSSKAAAHQLAAELQTLGAKTRVV